MNSKTVIKNVSTRLRYDKIFCTCKFCGQPYLFNSPGMYKKYTDKILTDGYTCRSCASSLKKKKIDKTTIISWPHHMRSHCDSCEIWSGIVTLPELKDFLRSGHTCMYCMQKCEPSGECWPQHRDMERFLKALKEHDPISQPTNLNMTVTSRKSTEPIELISTWHVILCLWCEINSRVTEYNTRPMKLKVTSDQTREIDFMIKRVTEPAVLTFLQPRRHFEHPTNRELINTARFVSSGISGNIVNSPEPVIQGCYDDLRSVTGLNFNSLISLLTDGCDVSSVVSELELDHKTSLKTVPFHL